MKKIFILSAMLMIGMSAEAQDTYLNERLSNTSNDLIGTSRYVSMGGAMGALGSDMSVIDWNPAGIALMRRNDISFTGSVIWDKDGTKSVKKAKPMLGQFGAVFCLPLNNEKGMNNLNMGVAFHNKKNFNNSFYANGALASDGMLGLSQMDQITALLNEYGTTDRYGVMPNLAATAGEFWYEDKKDPSKDYSFLGYNGDAMQNPYFNICRGQNYSYWQHTWGTVQGFDFNLSGNLNDRFYWGLTLGFDNLRYRMSNKYYEKCANPDGPDGSQEGTYSVYGDQIINGFGLNAKIGITVLPFENNPFRFFIALETPTAYGLNSSTKVQIEDHANRCSTKPIEGFLKYRLRTPVKFRMGIGTTIGKHVAMEADYEVSAGKMMRMSYPTGVDYNDTQISVLGRGDVDRAMNVLTEQTIKPMHTVRLGIEARASSKLSFRAGYNFISSPYKDNPKFSQLMESRSMVYSIGTNYMKMKPTNIITLGAGYRWKHCYFDMAYKIQAQKADFYAFDVDDAKLGASQSIDNFGKYVDLSYSMKDICTTPEPAQLNLVRHELMATFGVRF